MVTGYSLPFHVHILCIRYDTVLASGQHGSSMHACVYHGLPVGDTPWRLLLQHSNYIAKSIFHRRAWYRVHFLCPICVYSKFGQHPDPLGYLCAKFCFFHSLHCRASPWRKTAYATTHPAYLMPWELNLVLQNSILVFVSHP